MVTIVRVVLAAILCSLVSTSLMAEDLKALVILYLEASNRHDLATLRRMTATDATWQLGPDLLVGRDAVLGPNAWDAGAKTRLQWSNIVVKGNVVEFELVEHNDFLDALGMELRHFPRFDIEGGLVRHKEPRKPDAGRDERKFALLRAWVGEHHPEALAKLRTPDGKAVYTEEAGRVAAQLAREWAALQKAR